jgi:hypothetical protein
VPSSMRCPTSRRKRDNSTANLTGITLSERYPRVESNLKLGWPFSGDLESIDAVYTSGECHDDVDNAQGAGEGAMV